jgi:ATP-dependent DNA helicase RecG
VLPIHPGLLPREQVGEQVLAILEYCTEPRSKQEILIHQQLKPVFLNYKRHIMPLVEAGLLEMTIPDNPVAWRPPV